MNDYSYEISDYSQASTASPVLGAGVFLFVMLLSLAVYIYSAYCLVKIARKTNTPNDWLAWVPVVNMFYMIKVARLSMWWALAFFVPLLNIIAIIYVWMKISELLKRPSWWGILMIVSPINLILLWFYAFRDGDSVVSNISSTPTPTTPSGPIA